MSQAEGGILHLWTEATTPQSARSGDSDHAQLTFVTGIGGGADMEMS